MEGLFYDAAARHRMWCRGRVARGVDDRQFRMAFAAVLRDLPAVELSGQPDVGDQHVRNVALAPVQRLLSGACVDHVIACIAQRFDDEFSDQGIVLDEKYAHWRLAWISSRRKSNGTIALSFLRLSAPVDWRIQASHAKKTKTYQTSLGFYDLAIAAPSMKATLEALGRRSNLFHQGVAKETEDADVVDPAMTKPGVVLKRPAGSKGRFAEHSELPPNSAAARRRQPRAKAG